MTDLHYTIVPRTPWRLAVRRSRPAVYRSATPALCLPGADWPQPGWEVWSFDWLDTGASDRCLNGHRPRRRRQIASVVALIHSVAGAPRVALIAIAADAALVHRFATAYPFAVDRVIVTGEQDEPCHCRDLRGAAA